MQWVYTLLSSLVAVGWCHCNQNMYECMKENTTLKSKLCLTSPQTPLMFIYVLTWLVISFPTICNCRQVDTWSPQSLPDPEVLLIPWHHYTYTIITSYNITSITTEHTIWFIEIIKIRTLPALTQNYGLNLFGLCDNINEMWRPDLIVFWFGDCLVHSL